MEEKDIPTIVRLHSDYIPGALFPKLGDKFMYALYRSMLDLECVICYVWEEMEDSEQASDAGEQDGDYKVKRTKDVGGDKEIEKKGLAFEGRTYSEKVVGFITATTDSSVLFRQIMLRNLPLFVWRTFIYLLGNPLRIFEIWETVSYSSLAEVPGVSAELLFIAIEKNYRKKNISDILVEKCLEWAREKGHEKIKVTTYTTNRGANTLLERLGFAVARKVPFRNKELNLYVRHTSQG